MACRCKFSVPKNLIVWAAAIQFFLAISLPLIQALYIVQTTFNNSNNIKHEEAIGTSENLTRISTVQLGIWGACYPSQNNSHLQSNNNNDSFSDLQYFKYLRELNIRACYQNALAFAYNITIVKNQSEITVVEPSWSGALAIQVLAFGCTLISTYFVHRKSNSKTLIAVGVAGGTSVIATLIDLAFFLSVKGKMQTLGAGTVTNLGLGFWLTLFSTLLLCTAFFWIIIFMDKPPRMDYKKEDQYQYQTPTEVDSSHHSTAQVTGTVLSDTHKNTSETFKRPRNSQGQQTPLPQKPPHIKKVKWEPIQNPNTPWQSLQNQIAHWDLQNQKPLLEPLNAQRESLKAGPQNQKPQWEPPKVQWELPKVQLELLPLPTQWEKQPTAHGQTLEVQVGDTKDTKVDIYSETKHG